MNYTKEIVLNRKETKDAKNCLKNPSVYLDYTFSVTAKFTDEVEMDIKICPTDDGDFWTEAVLFFNGHEVCCSEPEDEFFGNWTLEYNGDVYNAVVIPNKSK